MGAVYCITNTKSDKVYIGSSTSVKERFYYHRYRLKRGDHTNIHLQRSWNKHGADAFEFEVIQDGIPNESLVEVEQLYLDANDNLFNINPVAGRPPHTPETRARMSAAAKKRDLASRVGGGGTFRGQKHTQETKEKMADAARGKRMSAATKAKMSAAKRKTHRFVSPDGDLVIVDNLPKWCAENGLDYGAMGAVSRGFSKSNFGWTRTSL